mgnify:CR=1 FL=1
MALLRAPLVRGLVLGVLGWFIGVGIALVLYTTLSRKQLASVR